MRFAVEVDRRCFAVSQGYADATRFSGKPGKRSRDADKPPRTMMAYVRLAQLILDSRERAVVAVAYQLLPTVRLSLPRNYIHSFISIVYG